MHIAHLQYNLPLSLTMFAVLSTLVLVASSALAMPSLYARQPSGICLGSNAITDGGPYNLVAVNKTDLSGPGLNLTTSPAIVDPIDYNRRSLAVSATVLHSLAHGN